MERPEVMSDATSTEEEEKEEVSLDPMTFDEVSYQKMLQSKRYGRLLLSDVGVSEIQTRLESDGFSSKDAQQIALRTEHFSRWMKDLGDDNMIEAIRKLDTDTPLYELARVNQLITRDGNISHFGNKPWFFISLQTGPGPETTELIVFWAGRTHANFRGVDGDYIAGFDDTMQRRLAKNPEKEDDELCKPWGCKLRTLELPNGGGVFVVMHVASLGEVGQDSFWLVWVLSVQQYWVISSYEVEMQWDENTEEPIGPEGPIAPENRVGIFPKTKTLVSVGELRGLFVDDVATLVVKTVEGYRVREAIRVEGKSVPL